MLSSLLLIHFSPQIGPVLVSWTLYHEVLLYLTFALIILLLQILVALGAGLLFHLGIEKPLLRRIRTSRRERTIQAA